MTSHVYFARLADGDKGARQADALCRAVLATGFQDGLRKKDMVAVKVHVGEKNNDTHVKPELVAAAVRIIKEAKGQAFITDTSTLYRGQRENGIRHAMLAHGHGFGIQAVGAPFIPVDGLSGNHEVEVEVGGELNRSVKIAGDLLLADAVVVISHVTAHIGSGLGAALKNVGMGLSSRAGKLRQHSTISPRVTADTCQACGKCKTWCPAGAMEERDNIAHIVQERCIGCGQCIAVCRYGAIQFNYSVESPILQKSMVEHAAGALKHFGNSAVFVNVLVDMTAECDCISKKQQKAIPDLGILASRDIVAVDKATMDITAKSNGKSLADMFYPELHGSIQMDHAQAMGLGTRRYELVEV